MPKKEKITKDMTFGAVIEKFPESAAIMMKHGLHCVGCHVAAWETVEQGVAAHGMSKEDLDKMMKEINSALDKKKKD